MASSRKKFLSSYTHELARVDGVDSKILHILSLDGRTSYADLAQATGLTAAGVKKRVMKMLRSGIFSISGRVRMDRMYSASAFIMIEADPRHTDALLRSLEKVSGVYFLAKAYDVHNVLLGIVVPSLPDIDRFLNTHITSLSGVRNVVVHVTDLPSVPLYL